MSALQFDQVSACYGERTVLNAVSASFEKGAVTGIVGPNGAGKTTLFRTALGLLGASGGQVRVMDKPLADWPREALARTIAYLPQSADAHWPLTAKRLVSLGRMPHRSALRPLTPEDDAAIETALARCDASDFANRRMDELSAGERARVLLARALATHAAILLADEPAAHLDPAHQLRLMDSLREEAGRGTAVAVTLHDLSLAARYCDHIVVLDKGRIAAHGTPDIALSDDTLARVFDVAALRAESGEGRSVLIGWRKV